MNRNRTKIPGYALAAAAIATAIIACAWIAAELGFDRTPVEGHCYGRNC